MTIRVIGSSHHLAPPSRLQAAVAKKEELFANLVRLQSQSAIRGAMLLATCNRLEVILDVTDDCECAARDDAQLVADVFGDAAGFAYHDHVGAEATHYLLRVATGLESMVRGEDQILGQLREAFKLADKHGLLSAQLRVLRTQLVAAARDTRRRTGLTKSQVSVASLAARQLERSGRNVVVVGAGETGRLALETLVKRDNCRILLVNRTATRAEALARHFGVESMSLRRFLEAAERGGDEWDWDGVLVAVDSREPIFHAQHVRDLKLVVDVSMPCTLADEARSVDGLEVLDLDAIAKLVEAEGARRSTALDTADELVAGKARALHRTLSETGNGRNLSRIVDQHLETALQELESLLSTRLRHLSADDRDVVRQAVLRTTRRNAHLHLKDVRELSGV